MKAILFVVLAGIWGLASSASLFNDRQSFFRHRGRPAEKRVSPLQVSKDGHSLRDLTTRWLKRYYHETNSDLDERSESLPKYKFDSPESLQWLVENIMDTPQDANDFPSVRDHASHLKTGERLQQQPFSDDSGSDALKYSDIYGVAPSLNRQAPMENSFQQTLRNYLAMPHGQEENESEEKSKTPKTETSHQQETASPILQIDTTTSSTSTNASSTLDALSKVTAPSVSPTMSSNSLNVIPPVHFDKGQKEYPMLRPASENTRKFENWAEKFEKSMVGPDGNIVPPMVRASDKNRDDDHLTEQLDMLKARSRRHVNLSEMAFF